MKLTLRGADTAAGPGKEYTVELTREPVRHTARLAWSPPAQRAGARCLSQTDRLERPEGRHRCELRRDCRPGQLDLAAHHLRPGNALTQKAMLGVDALSAGCGNSAPLALSITPPIQSSGACSASWVRRVYGRRMKSSGLGSCRAGACCIGGRGRTHCRQRPGRARLARREVPGRPPPFAS